MVKTRIGRVTSRPVYAAIGVTLAGDKDVLGLWVGQGGEGGQGAKFWMSVLADLKNRGIKDAFFVVCDGLKSPPEVAATPGRRRSCRPAPCITPTCRLRPSGGGSCWRRARSSREGRLSRSLWRTLSSLVSRNKPGSGCVRARPDTRSAGSLRDGSGKSRPRPSLAGGRRRRSCRLWSDGVAARSRGRRLPGFP
jgi:Transposase, Mutator family